MPNDGYSQGVFERMKREAVRIEPGFDLSRDESLLIAPTKNNVADRAATLA